MIRRSASRIATVLRRRSLDGRLAEPTAVLLGELARLRIRAARQRMRAALRSPKHGAIALAVGPSPFDGWRRWSVVGQIDCSLLALKHRFADDVLQNLESVGLQPWLIDDTGNCLHFGLRADDRDLALMTLRGIGRAEPWYLGWRRGHRYRCASLGTGCLRRASRAESWWVFQCLGVGDDGVAGPAQAAMVSFWTPGANGRLERLGHRGLHRFDPDSPQTEEHLDGHRYPGSASFPVQKSLSRLQEPVDVVYTWVDGDDAEWNKEFTDWSRIERTEDRKDHAAHSSRYTSRDELRYSLRSLWLNADWVRHVYIVTADQRPNWLIEDDRLKIVSHREILDAAWLPTFNSHAIEARLHHIDGLAEHFIYFNDDMYLGAAVSPEHFFTANGLSKFFESGARVPTANGLGTELAVDTAAQRGQEIIDREFGARVSHKLHHAPYALKRSVLYEIEERFTDVVTATCQQRFRSPTDLSIPSAFAHHYGFCTGRAIPGVLRVGYENLGGQRLPLFLRRALLGRDLDAFCINETERWETGPASAEARLSAFLDRYYPIPSPWERMVRRS